MIQTAHNSQLTTHDPLLVLASASPRRAEILTSLGIPFRVRPADLEEEPLPGETAEAAASRLAAEKAASVAALEPDRWVLGADTLVFLDGLILGKPRDAEDARRMLRQLAGREHRVVTAIHLMRGGEPGGGSGHAEISRVRFAPMDESEIAWYAATGEPADKAGAYGVQGLGARFIEAIHGSFTNVMGLPARACYRLLRDARDPSLASLALSSG